MATASLSRAVTRKAPHRSLVALATCLRRARAGWAATPRQRWRQPPAGSGARDSPRIVRVATDGQVVGRSWGRGCGRRPSSHQNGWLSGVGSASRTWTSGALVSRCATSAEPMPRWRWPAETSRSTSSAASASTSRAATPTTCSSWRPSRRASPASVVSACRPSSPSAAQLSASAREKVSPGGLGRSQHLLGSFALDDNRGCLFLGAGGDKFAAEGSGRSGWSRSRARRSTGRVLPRLRRCWLGRRRLTANVNTEERQTEETSPPSPKNSDHQLKAQLKQVTPRTTPT